MMVQFAILFKAALINTGGHNGSVCDIHDCNRLIPVCKRLLHTDPEGRALRFVSDAHNVSAKADHSTLYIF